MAERRMFAKSIVLSDAFLDMPMSARCLYFTLGMFADDDGFIGCPKAIMRQCGASQDDLQILLAKRFVLGWENGVIVIKHWRINNYLRQDRYAGTTYVEEKETLALDEKGAYTELEKQEVLQFGIPMVDQRSTNGIPSIGKDRIDYNNNIVLSFTDVQDNTHSPSDEGEPEKPQKKTIDYEKIMCLFNQICKSFPKITVLSDNRKKAIRARFNSGYDYDSFTKLFEKAEASDFLKGGNDRNWSADFDWMVKDSSMAKILDGNYDNDKAKSKKPSPYASGIAANGSDPNKYKNMKSLKQLREEEKSHAGN